MPTTWACSMPTSSTDLDSSINFTSGGVAAQLRFTHKEKSGYFQNLREFLWEKRQVLGIARMYQGKKKVHLALYSGYMFEYEIKMVIKYFIHINFAW